MKNKKGMSILELMIVIAIMGIMTAAAMVSFSGNRPKKEVEVEARKFAAAIREAQNYALTGKKGSGSDKACGWGVILGASPSSDYKIFYNRLSSAPDCAAFNSGLNNRNYPAASSVDFIRYDLNKVISGSVAPKGAYFTIPFGPAHNGTSGCLLAGDTAPSCGGLSGPVKFKMVSATDANAKYTICIYPSGMVSEMAGDPSC